MKLIIAGGRTQRLSLNDLEELSRINGVSEVVSGHAHGVDRDGEKWAQVNSIPIILFPADWDRYGKSAGAIRNGEMAKDADAVALFPGGRGTENMFATAKREGLIIFDYR